MAILSPLRSACSKCREVCRACCQVWCTERVLCRVAVLGLHVALVADVVLHRPDELLHVRTRETQGMWLLVAATLAAYLWAALADPGWSSPPRCSPAPSSARPGADGARRLQLAASGPLGSGGCSAGGGCCCCAVCASLAAAPAALLRGPATELAAVGGSDVGAPEGEEEGARGGGRGGGGLGGEGGGPGDEEQGGVAEMSPLAPGEVEGIQKRRGGAEGGGEGAGPEPAGARDGVPAQSGQELRWCTKCDIYQPLRTKHCKECGRCVRTHDHHCPWIGNCVGENNRVVFFWFLVFQVIELTVFFIEGLEGISVVEPSVALIVGLLFIAMFFIMVICLLGFHTFLAIGNLTTWEHVSWRRITYLKDLRDEGGSPFSRSVSSNVAAYCCGPPWCPAPLRRLAALRYDGGGAILWELAEPRTPCWLRFCVETCGC